MHPNGTSVLPTHSRPVKEELLLAHFIVKETEAHRGGYCLSPSSQSHHEWGRSSAWGSDQAWAWWPLQVVVTVILT